MDSDEQSGALDRFFASRTPLIILAGLIVVSLIAVCVLGVLLLRNSNNDTAVSDAEPTPFPDASGNGARPEDALVVGVSDSSTVTVTLDIPVSLDVGGKTFPVQPQTVTPDGVWTPGLEDNETAGWVYGTIVNYVLGLRASNQNQELLESLAPGDTIALETEGGTTYRFDFESRQVVPITDPSVFTQNTPGVTLLLLEAGGEERLVVRGRYLVEETESAGADAVIELGETAQLANLQLTITGVTYVPDRPETPPGFAFFLVEFQAQNVGSEPVNLNDLRLTLSDELGNQYSLSPVAAQLGQNPPLPGGALNPGESVSATVGYQIPAGLVSNTLRWTVNRTDTGEQVQVNIPFSDVNAAQNAAVTLQSVTVSEDATTLTLTGQITNNGTQPLVVTQEDVILRTSDGASYLVLSANPPFPWTAPAGQSLSYSVIVQRPSNADSAIFTVLNQPFQLNNLR